MLFQLMAPVYRRCQREPLVRDNMPSVSNRTENVRENDSAVKNADSAPANAATIHRLIMLPPTAIAGFSSPSITAYRQKAAEMTPPAAVTAPGSSGSWKSS